MQDAADNRTGKPSETPTPLPLGLVKITCQRDPAPDRHLVSPSRNRKQLLLLGGAVGGVERTGERAIHNFPACAGRGVAIAQRARWGNSGDPAGMPVPSSEGTERKSRLPDLNHRRLLILSKEFRRGTAEATWCGVRAGSLGREQSLHSSAQNRAWHGCVPGKRWANARVEARDALFKAAGSGLLR